MAKGALNGVPQAVSVNEKQEANPSVSVLHFPASETVAALIAREGVQDVWHNSWYLLTFIFSSGWRRDEQSLGAPMVSLECRQIVGLVPVSGSD